MKKLFLLLSVVLLLCACNHNDEPASVTNRTVLVYMVADNSLSANVQANLDSMMYGYKATSNVGNLLIYLDNANSTPVLYKLSKDKNGSVTKDIVKNYSEQNSLDVSVMKGILSDAYASYPAESYGLVLWSHGYSWIPSPSNTVTTKWFGQDNSTKTNGDSNNYMDIPDLANALSAAPHLDFIMFDACFMSSAEVAYELKDKTDYLIAAPTEVIDLGFPYRQIIAPMFSSDKNYTQIASDYYNYYNSMDGEYKSATIAVIKCSELDNLAAATKKIISAHVSDVNSFVPSSLQLYDRVSYSSHFAYDLGNFIQDIATTDEWTAYQKQLDATVIYKKATSYFIELKIDYDHYSGLAAYVPKVGQATYVNFFKTLSWHNAAGWNQTVW